MIASPKCGRSDWCQRYATVTAGILLSVLNACVKLDMLRLGFSPPAALALMEFRKG